MPTSLRGLKQDPSFIEESLRQKIAERLKNDHPLSNLHKLFKTSHTSENPRLVDRNGLREVLMKFDIFPVSQCKLMLMLLFICCCYCCCYYYCCCCDCL